MRKNFTLEFVMWSLRVMAELSRFRSKNRIYILCLLCLAFISTIDCYSQNDVGIEKIQYNIFASTTYFPTASNLEIGANSFLTYSPESAEINNTRKIENIIKLSLFEEIPIVVPADFTASVQVLIEYGSSSSSTTSMSQTLTVTYSKAGGVKYNAKNYFVFEDAQFVKITVQQINTSLIGTFDPKSMLILENEMRVTRFYQLAGNLQSQPAPGSVIPSAGDDELSVTWQWPQNTGNTHTQLEWTWVEDEMLSHYMINNTVDHNLIFKNNATRLDLPLNFTGYNIPLLYGGPGSLYFRVRPINITSESRTEGPWSATGIREFSGHNKDLNWQVTTTFAEEGKRKVVIQYFDGSLRSRQTVTKENVTNTTVTAETLYDGEGRPAIQILPAPGINNIIGYTKNLNLFNGQVANQDPSLFFDLQPINSSSNETPALNKEFGTARYFSENNSEELSSLNKNTPDAEGYPYAVTRYTPDATGRIMSQSGVGMAMKMGSGHETKYYYGTASQEELDGLFGTEVGNFTHYFKNMVKDANGQMSVSYVDMHGRTIATALAGDKPNGLTALPISDPAYYPNQGGTEISRNLLTENTNLLKGNSIESVNTLLVPATTQYEFSYKLTPQSLTLTANNQEVCYDCMYDLVISITDESGDLAPKIIKYNNVNLSADDNCGTLIQGLKEEAGNPVTGNQIVFYETLAPGSYIIRKTLTISEASLEKYKQEYLVKALIETEEQLITSIYNEMLLTSTCDDPPTDVCIACTTALGTFNTFKNAYLLNSPATPLAEIQKLYDTELLNCERLCSTTSQVVNIKRELMVADMMAYSGQYSKEFGQGAMYDLYNIDPDTNPAGSNPDLAESLLLSQHPEYSRLIYAESVSMKNVFNWITTFMNTVTYADAVSKGYISNPKLIDPFYSISGLNVIYSQAMSNKLASYIPGIEMWQMAYGNVMYKHIVNPVQRKNSYLTAPLPPYSSLSGTDQNKIWNEFKKLYAAERNNHVNAHIAETVSLPNAQSLIDQGYILHFPNNNDQLAQQFDNNSETGSDWAWYPPTSNGDLNSSFTPINPTDIYSGRCDSYIQHWKQILSECPALSSHVDKEAILTEITNAMKEICIKASNDANPYGASTLPNGSTGTTYQSFEAAINAVFANRGISQSNLCNPFVIEWPRPYSSGLNQTETINIVDSCNCDRWEEIKTEALLAESDPANFINFNQFLITHYGESISQQLYDALMQNCALLGTIYCDTVGHGATLECLPVGNAFVLQVAQPMPAFLKCGFTERVNCLSCAELSGFITELKNIYINLGTSYVPEPLFTGSNLTAKNIQDNILFARFVNFRTGFHYLWTDYAQKAVDEGCNLDTYAANTNANQQVICRDNDALNDLSEFITVGEPCQDVYQQAVYKAQMIIKQRKIALLEDFESAYRAKCLQNIDQETFNVKYSSKEYHFTLYYYDMAGNLVKTVPPKGVRPDFSTEYTALVKANRIAGTQYVPPHVLVTNYRYNSLNQVVAQHSPDGNTSKFWYDRLGRLVVSQNAQQIIDGKYSYTLYDDFGRIKEVGQKPQTTLMTQTISQDDEDLNEWITINSGTGGAREQITLTQYDIAYGTDQNFPNGIFWGVGLNQVNLRNRVSFSITKKLESDILPYTGTFYSYDIHGNVDNLLQDYNGITEMGASDHRHKRINYDYDLISGKVNAVNYQAPFFNTVDNAWEYPKDQFYHRYKYDAENRLTSVETSRDKIIWETDARYNYYKHGPLARTELGQLRVQGIDYVYTLQGWLKGVNPGSSVGGEQQCAQGSAVDAMILVTRDLNIFMYTARQSISFEPGFESGVGDAFETSIDANLVVCSNSSTPSTTIWDEVTPSTRDAYSFGLHYYNEDYKPIAGVNAPNFIPVLGGTMGSNPLFNGNIAAMSVNIPKLGGANVYSYEYDQLNRLLGMKTYTGLTSTGFTPVPQEDYEEKITYDPNGNILTYFRNGTLAGGNQLAMDDMTYQYPRNSITGEPINNRLRYIGDITSAYTEDLKTQTSLNRPQIQAENLPEQVGDNYRYDAIGNLIYDGSEGLTNIKWNVYGKIESITKNGNNINYSYDASGNRISKSVNGNITVYVRDASGNVMSVYEGPIASTLKQMEIHLYGSSRLGILGELSTAPIIEVDGGITTTRSVFTRGEKVYELSNHLGNVLVTIGDKKIGHEAGDGTYNYYTADVVNANDYYPFGMLMPGRKYAASGLYKYGFNGKENDNEVIGEGNQQDYGMRVYDPRLGKFLSVDPLTQQYPYYSPFQFASNMPIWAIDIDGMESDKQPNNNERKTNETLNNLDDILQGGEAQLADKLYRLNVGIRQHAKEILKNRVLKKDVFQRMLEAEDDPLSDEAKFASDLYKQYDNAEKAATENFKNLVVFKYKALKFDVKNAELYNKVLDMEIQSIKIGISAVNMAFTFLPSGGTSAGFFATTATSSGRVFWSGGQMAREAAENFARSRGMVTLEMTTQGKILESLTKMTSYRFTKPLWTYASKSFAREANGHSAVFINFNKLRSNSVWMKTEKPILQSKNFRITTYPVLIF